MIWLIDKGRITKNKIVCIDEEGLKEKLEELLYKKNPITLKIIKEALNIECNEYLNLLELFDKANFNLDVFEITNYYNETIHTDFNAFISVLPYIRLEAIDSYGINHLKKIQKVFVSRGITNLEASIILNNVEKASNNSKILTVANTLINKENARKM